MTGPADERPGWSLTLYVSGASPRSAQALETVRRLCDEDLRGQVELLVVDVAEDPARAATDRILAVPTLVKRLPAPRRQLVGDLADLDRVRAAVVLGGPHGQQLYTLVSADRPYRVIVEEMGDGAVTVSGRGIILYANRRLADLVGADRAALLGRDVTELVDASAANTLLSLL